MEKILIIGEESLCQLLRKKLDNKVYEIEVSDGDDEEDFKNFDIIFDLNFDDDSENFPIYAGLRDKLIFLSSVKQSIAESAYIYPAKVRSHIFGINAVEYYLNTNIIELSAYRKNEWSIALDFMSKFNLNVIQVEDVVGMFRPRVDFLAINEKIKLLNENIISLENDFFQKDFQFIDKIGVTPIFEVLMAIYEDTKDVCYLPNTMLKKKYLRNHSFVK
ncbi:MAG: hypothetical protein JNL75_02045 [Chitinophagales bacterium]|nr:hypothetical protein [Chitinophagales bacterium]